MPMCHVERDETADARATIVSLVPSFSGTGQTDVPARRQSIVFKCSFLLFCADLV